MSISTGLFMSVVDWVGMERMGRTVVLVHTIVVCFENGT